MDEQHAQQGSGGDQRASAEEWRELFRQFDQQIRREAARVVGVQPVADWGTIGRQAGENARRSAARSVGLSEDADWEDIGRRLETTVRTSAAKSVGAAPDADWTVVGQTVEQKVRAFMQDLFEKKPPESKEKPDDLVDPWR